MIILLSILWFIRTARAILFWLYLWQLKEYHFGRFIDHFRTAKGKTLFFNPLFLLKIILVLVSLSLPWQDYRDNFILILIALYGGEAMWAGRAFLQGKLLKPVLTLKTSFLVFRGIVGALIFLLLVFIFFKRISLSLLLAFDILVPLIVSLNVFSLQPLVAFFRNRIIAKARKKRETFPHLKVIGITGSYGKTSTKEFLAHILSKKFKVLKTKEHQNSEVGISQCILNDLEPEHQVFVCEMGAYNKGGIKLLASIAKPTIGVLTGINEQHMATFGSQENIIQAKYELIESLPPNGIAFFNAKNSYCVELYEKTNIKKIFYGQAARFRGEENILGAMAVARELGMSEEEISRAVKEVENIFPGAQIKKGKDGLAIIDATYSANPDGVMAGLEYLKTFPGNPSTGLRVKKIIVMPCLIELGKASKEVHKRIGAKIAEVCDLAIITTKDRFEDIREAASAKASASQREVEIVCMENSEEIVEKIKSTAHTGDVVLLEGRVPYKVLELLV